MDNDSLSFLVVKHLAFCTHVETTFSGRIHIGDTVDAVDACAGRKIRTFYVFHVFFYRDVGASFRTGFEDAVNVQVHGTCHLGQVVRRDASGHSNRNTVAAVQQQIGKPGGQDRRFLF